jgi:hypothetical protein
MAGTSQPYAPYQGSEDCTLTWQFRLGDWVRCQDFLPEAVFIVVWREHRETPWGDRRQYGLLPIEDLDLDPRHGEKALALEIGQEEDLTAYDGDEDGQTYRQLHEEHQHALQRLRAEQQQKDPSA